MHIPHSIRQLLHDHHSKLPNITWMAADGCIDVAMLGQPSKRPLLLADDASFAAAAPLLRGIDSLNKEQILILPAPAKPDLGQAIAHALKQARHVKAGGVIVVGSGSLSDMGKYIAAELSIPLTIIATAPSMNGYSSANASLIQNGAKQSVSCVMADHIIAHEGIIAAAPSEMIEAGKWDALSSISAELDWLLSHMLLGTAYYANIFDAQLPAIHALLSTDTKPLMELLLLQGLGMTVAKSSAPASGGEHMLGHLLELCNAGAYAGLLHGQLIRKLFPSYLQYQIKLVDSLSGVKLRNIPSDTEVKSRLGKYYDGLQAGYDDKLKQRQTHEVNMRSMLMHDHEMIQTALKARLQQVAPLLPMIAEEATQHHANDWHEWLDIAFLTRGRFTMLDLCVAPN